MPNKVELNTLTQVGNNEVAFLYALNENLTRIQQAINDTLSRTGVVPNQMEQAIDMNGFEILNVKSGKGPRDVVTRADIQELITKVEQSIAELNKVIPDAQSALLSYAQEVVSAARAELEALEGSARASAEAAAESETNAATDAMDAEQYKNSAEDSANRARIWAEGNDSEVIPLGGDHSSKVSAQLSQAYANADFGETVEDYASTHKVVVQGKVAINDNSTTSITETWSAFKIASTIGNVEDAINSL